MLIKSLEINNFRNYENARMDFHSETNILFGDNAQGKTNILEAIYLCGTTKSHKGSKDKEVIKMGEEEAHIKMMIEKNQMNHKIDMHLKMNSSKGIAIDGVPIRKSSDYLGMVHIVFFSPEDLSIIKEGPAGRRRFMNIELCQLDKMYLNDLTKYNKVIMQRNNLLKQISFNRNLLDTLNIWDIQLMEYGKTLIHTRKEFIRRLNEIVCEIHSRLSGGKETLYIKYEPNTEIECFDDKLEKYREKDLLLKTTHVGPHRDDISFLINDIDIRKYGSQGQQRTVALSLKLAEIELVKRIIGESPILLLDDVLSELDRNRQNYLISSIKDTQTIITCTGMEEFIRSSIQLNCVFEIKNGTVQKES